MISKLSLKLKVQKLLLSNYCLNKTSEGCVYNLSEVFLRSKCIFIANERQDEYVAEIQKQFDEFLAK